MNNVIEWTIEEDFAGTRLDAAINKNFGSDLSRTRIQEMLKNGRITLDGRTVKPGYKVKGGEKVIITLPEKEPESDLVATPINFPIIYEDEHIIVINKPSGLVVHPGAGREKETVVSALLSHTRLSPIGAPLRPGVVQRLDKETSGIMLLAKTKEAHKKLVAAFSSHNIEKEYLAIIQGHIVNRKGRIEVAIERDKVHRKRMKATSPEKGRMAVSCFEVIEYLKTASLVRVTIKTGRTHQIRVHMAFTGHPLLGDTLYGGHKYEGKSQHFLHSARLSMKHPITGRQMEWKAPIPEPFKMALTRLGMTKTQELL
ncbi:MAG: RluA family pseudouridine synthase [Candidatus Rifleibacteriota bacterium]